MLIKRKGIDILKLTREEFDILSEIAVSKRKIGVRALMAKTKYSSEKVNDILKKISKKKYIENGVITDAGLAALEPYRVKRAVFIAAGFGSRMVPITLNTPKPLVRVRKKRIIDTLLDACIKAEIEEIYIVRGHLWEQFDQLLYKYPMIKFIENPRYYKANNIFSVMLAGKLVKNAYILEADLFVSNPDIITKYQYSSNFLGIKVDKSDDWCFTMKDGYIDRMCAGGENCYQEVGIAYIAPNDSKQLLKDIKELYKTDEGKKRLWEYTLFNEYKEHYKVEVRECKKEDIIEIDTFDELKALDNSYDV